LKRALLVTLVLFAGLTIGYLVGSPSAGHPARAGRSPALPASVASQDSDREIARLGRENEALRRKIAELEGLLAGKEGRERAAKQPVRLAEATEDPATGAVRAVLSNASGDAVAGMPVEVSRATATGESERHEATSGPDGVAMVAGLEPGRWFVSVRFADSTRMVDVQILGGRVTEVALPAPTGRAAVVGLVRDASRGPLPGVRVTLTSGDSLYRDFFSATTDGTGRYRIAGVPPGTYAVGVSGGAILRGPLAEVVVPTAGAIEHDILIGFPSLEGIVLDAATGRPVAGARVGAQRSGTFRNAAGATTQTDGTFRLFDLGPGTYRLSVAKDGYGREYLKVAVPFEAGRLVVKLEPAATLRIRVLRPDGKPCVGLIILAINPKDGKPKGRGTAVTADKDGRAAFRQILPGQYEITFIANRIGSARREIAIEPGENSLDVQLE
jgi:hypothetical protein